MFHHRIELGMDSEKLRKNDLLLQVRNREICSRVRVCVCALIHSNVVRRTSKPKKKTR